jgi:hypothetical protein
MPETVESRLLAREALCFFHFISSMLTIKAEATSLHELQNWPMHCKVVTFWHQRTPLYDCHLTMQGEIDVVAPISPELHKRKLADETLPRVSLTFGISTMRGTAPCSSDTWESLQVWLKSVRCCSCIVRAQDTTI